MMQYLPLMGLLTKRVVDLTDDDLDKVATVCFPGATISPYVRSAARELLQAENIDAVSDVIARPEVLNQLRDLVTAKPQTGKDDRVVRCGHCQNFSLI